MNTQNTQVQQFVDKLLNLDAQPGQPLAGDELAWRIWKILTDEQRLARRPDDKFREAILAKIKKSIEQEQPITLIDTAGGFKNYAAPNAPHVDWSEVFMLNKLVKQCVKVASIYKPGVWLEFSGDSCMLTFFDNYPKEAIDTYAREFGQLLSIFQKHVPANVKLTKKDVDEFYDIPKFQERIEKLADQMPRAEIEALVKKNRLKARHNFMLKGVKDYSAASEQELDAALERSVVLDHIYIDIDIAERFEYIEGGLHIPLIQTAIPGCIALKSVNTSKLAFWLGSGYLRPASGKLIPYIQHGQTWSELKNLEYCEVESPFSVIDGLDKIPVQE